VLVRYKVSVAGGCGFLGGVYWVKVCLWAIGIRGCGVGLGIFGFCFRGSPEFWT